MVGYTAIFPKRHTFLAVVHAEDEAQVMRNVAIACDNGADGVFLINHSIPAAALIGLHAVVRRKHPGYWAGLNLLGLDPRKALEILPPDAGGLWTDNAGITEDRGCPEAEAFAARRKASPWAGLYFGGVAFKYQGHVKDPARVAALAMPFVDVITSSGAGTGSAPSPEKIRAMRAAIGDHPLAIASGITPENAHLFTPHADCFLVATGVSDSHTELNAKRVRALADALAA